MIKFKNSQLLPKLTLVTVLMIGFVSTAQALENISLMAGGEAAINCGPLQSEGKAIGKKEEMRIAILPVLGDKITPLVVVSLNGKIASALQFNHDTQNLTAKQYVLDAGMGTLTYEQSKDDSNKATLKLDKFMGQTGEMSCVIEAVSFGS